MLRPYFLPMGNPVYWWIQRAPPTGPNFFSFCTCFHQKAAKSDVSAPCTELGVPQREILDLPLLYPPLLRDISGQSTKIESTRSDGALMTINYVLHKI